MIEAISSVGAANLATLTNLSTSTPLPAPDPVFLAANQAVQSLSGSPNVGDGGKFDNFFVNQLNNVNGQLQRVDQEAQTLALDGTQSLHQFMIHMEESKLSFQLVMQVRNRLLEAYQEVMRTQV
jgi:flagellar hook-basal body complex protein FliE